QSQKLALFCESGIDIAIICDFADVKDMSPEEFVSDVLINKCHVDTAICGFNFTFGKNASGSAEDLREFMESHGKNAVIVAPVKCENDIANSSSIRVMIERGDMENARKMLGRYFFLEAAVEGGNKIGRTIGVPTINQFFPENSVIPKRGTYASKCVIDGKEYISVSNVGLRPTVSENGARNCETHIIDFSGNLYGKTVKVEFCKYIREEIKFDSLEKLGDRIKKDIDFTKTYFYNKG
ncbi:MAG: hypothetical protein KBS59_02575, partial [Clostridiales bacterium]|nr:hypothetical protein [Clostridiales bacterium]